MSIKAVLSDLGGVLIDYSVDVAVTAWARLANVDASIFATKLVVDDAWMQFEVGRLTEAQFCNHLRRQCGLDLTDEEVIEGWNSIFLGVNAEVERLLRQVAHRVRVVAVTNTNVAHQRVWRARFATNVAFFAAVYSSWEIHARKPEPAFFEHVLESERVAPEEALFIDDLPVNVEGAARLGIDAVHYTGMDSLRDALASRDLL